MLNKNNDKKLLRVKLEVERFGSLVLLVKALRRPREQIYYPSSSNRMVGKTLNLLDIGSKYNSGYHSNIFLFLSLTLLEKSTVVHTADSQSRLSCPRK